MPDTLAQNGRAFAASVTRIDADRAIAQVDVGPIRLSSIWITGLSGAAPVPTWPRTTRGYTIIEVAEPLRGQIEKTVVRLAKNAPALGPG